ncbi:patatin-like phospholipase family protein [Oceanithermus sp.]
MASLGGQGKKRGLILALSGGGVRGFAHLGALRVLRDAGLPIAGVAGSSAGAYAAASYALGLPLEVEPLLNHVIDRKLAGLFMQGGNRLLHLAKVQVRLFRALRDPAIDDAQRLREGLLEYFGDVRIEETPVPLAFNAADLNTGEVVVLREGPLVDGLLASSAIPGVFPPVPWGGRLLVDGDIVEKVPETAARRLGDGPVVGVDVSNPVRLHKPRNSFEVMLMASEASIRRLKELALERCDYALSLVPEEQIDTFDYSQARQVYELGVARTEAALEEIRALLGRQRGLLAWLQRVTHRGEA